MDSILLVDDNKFVLSKIHSIMLKYTNEFDVISVTNGEKAIGVLMETHIDLVVTDLVMPHTDGLTLLAYINDHYPHILCIAMTGYASDNIIKMLPDNLVQLIQKPFKIYELIAIIKSSLKQKPPAGSLNGISIPSFLQLIEMEEKSCALDVTLANNKKGTFLFREGRLYDATFESMKGESAAIEMLQSGEKAAFILKTLPNQDIPRKINSGTSELLLKAAWAKDINSSSQAAEH